MRTSRKEQQEEEEEKTCLACNYMALKNLTSLINHRIETINLNTRKTTDRELENCL